MRLESERLVLAPIQEEDFDLFVTTDMDPEVMKFLRKASETKEEARKHFDRLRNYKPTRSGLGVFTVREKKTETFLGFGFLINIELNPENPDVEVGYRLVRTAWGKGIATEIATTLIRYGFDVLKLKEVFGTTHPDHHVSQKTLMKAGLKPNGTASYYNGCAFFKLVNDQS